MDKERFFHFFTRPNTDIENIEKLIEVFGEKTTLCEILTYIKSRSPYIDRPYKCPKCKGNGYTVREYNGYPKGLPDSGWVYEPVYDYRVCDDCDGYGYVKSK